MKKALSRKKIIIILIVVVILAAIYPVYKLIVGMKMSEETAVRDSWEMETGELIRDLSGSRISVHEADSESSIEIFELVPDDVSNEKFTIYNTAVQDRLEDALTELKSEGAYTIDAPLAVWNPYGTGSNGLYIYFEGPEGSLAEYTVHTENEEIPDFSAVANAGEGAEKEFLIIGLVPGETCSVTVELKDGKGEAIGSTDFTVEVPETLSGYPTRLEHTEGSSSKAELTDGLFYTLGTQGYYGYMFFFDNDGVMRYEMLLDGFKADRILKAEDESGDIYCCVAADRIGRINRLGKAVRIYKTGGHALHHDFTYGAEGKLIALATKSNNIDDRVMDRVIEIDLVTGNVKEVLDLKNIFQRYYRNTEKISDTDTFFWQAGTRDWIHLNTIDYTEDGGVILSSRETSTIIKINDIDGKPSLGYLIGDRAFWEGTPYADSVLDKDGEFTGQYGQHTVDAVYDGSLPEGQYYIMMYNNNFYCNGTRKDDYEPVLDERVSTDLMVSDDKFSYLDIYLVDENAGTYSLAFEFEVPYSSIVSSTQYYDGNFVVNSGVSEVFGEYDTDGELIRQYSYESDFQGYRVMKDTFAGFWFK